ncbi:MAG TPA: phosphate acyltransferase PlsX [Myxococcota bacterium]|nr:phosphate acyltransferase PlsX [Myxococcota bacterium]
MSAQPRPLAEAPDPAPRPVSRRIALDGMGGDFAPEVVSEAAARLSRTTDIQLLLLGDEGRLRPLLREHDADLARIDLQHAPDAVPMHESPRAALARKESSIALAVGAVARGEAEALVSAGNTGAVLLHTASLIPRLARVRRPALAAVYPTLPRPHNPDPFALLLDVGANVHCTATDLLQFAAMGTAYAARISKVPEPSVGLLNIGEEANKGDALLREAHALLRAAPGIHFVGNVEGKDVPLGAVDVIVCPGILGNVVLKLLESLGDVVLALGQETFQRSWRWRMGRRLLGDGIESLTRFFDASGYGGAPILGFERIVIKAHGCSNARAIENAVKVAAKAVRDDVCGAIAAGMREIATDPSAS